MTNWSKNVCLGLAQLIRLAPVFIGGYKRQHDRDSAIDFFRKNIVDGSEVWRFGDYDTYIGIKECVAYYRDPNSPFNKCGSPWEEDYDQKCHKSRSRCKDIKSKAEELLDYQKKWKVMNITPLDAMFLEVFNCHINKEDKDVVYKNLCDDIYTGSVEKYIKDIKTGFSKGNFRDDYIAVLCLFSAILTLLDYISFSFILTPLDFVSFRPNVLNEVSSLLGVLIFSHYVAQHVLPYQSKNSDGDYVFERLQESVNETFPDSSQDAINDIFRYAEDADKDAENWFRISCGTSIACCIYFLICSIRILTNRHRDRDRGRGSGQENVEMMELESPPTQPTDAQVSMGGSLDEHDDGIAVPGADFFGIRGVLLGGHNNNAQDRPATMPMPPTGRPSPDPSATVISMGGSLDEHDDGIAVPGADFFGIRGVLLGGHNNMRG